MILYHVFIGKSVFSKILKSDFKAFVIIIQLHVFAKSITHFFGTTKSVHTLIHFPRSALFLTFSILDLIVFVYLSIFCLLLKLLKSICDIQNAKIHIIAITTNNSTNVKAFNFLSKFINKFVNI
jgi:hypothetical protein